MAFFGGGVRLAWAKMFTVQAKIWHGSVHNVTTLASSVVGAASYPVGVAATGGRCLRFLVIL